MNGYDMNWWGWAGVTLAAVITVAILGLVWVIASRVASRACARRQPANSLMRGWRAAR